ncbi:hypothetical protein Q7P36_000032 [Cladosporium allicinum]
MPRDKAANEARHIARVVRRRADRVEDERGYQVPEGTGEVEDSSDSSAEEAAQDAGDLPRRLAPAPTVPVPPRVIALPVGWMRRRQLQVSQAVILAAQRHHDLGLLPGTIRLIEQAMLLRHFPIGARLRELVAIIAALLPDAWRRLRGRQRREEREEREVEKQAKADRLLQEELAQQRTKAKKQRKQRALKKKNAALDDVSASSVWQAVKSFGKYSNLFSLTHPAEVKPTGAHDD